MLWQRT